MNSEHDRVSAYLGGAMTSADAAAFEHEMAGDPELAIIVERWRRNDEILRRAFDKPEASDVSDALLKRLGLAETVVDNHVVGLDDYRKHVEPAQNENSVWARWRQPLVGSIAASLIVAVTLGIFWSSEPTGIGGQEAFQTAMDRSPSGTAIALDDSEILTPILSFEAKDGRFCREFAVEGHPTGDQGIACKSGSAWEVEALVKGGATLPSNGEIHTAGGDDGAKLADAYRRLGASDPLNASKEKLLISDGWKNN